MYVCVPTPIRYYNLSHQIFAEINAPCMNSALLEFKSHLLLSSAAVTAQNSSVSVINRGCPSASTHCTSGDQAGCHLSGLKLGRMHCLLRGVLP